MKIFDKHIKNIGRYLDRQKLHLVEELPRPSSQLRCCIVIPAYNEADLFETLSSLNACDAAPFVTEVIMVLNSSELSSDVIRQFHRKQHDEINRFSSTLPVHSILLENIPRKTAGVGFARKTGMDLALTRLSQTSPIDGIIICLDGDCQVSKNYLKSIQEHFQHEDSKQAAHLYFEHPFPEDPQLRKSIIEYEMHLRLMKLFLQSAGHPQAFHAVGSCLAVRAWAYAAQGGMNSRQAGEDFYFIHKFSKIGQLEELHGATVYPASRESDRVPFGTGAAMNKNMSGLQQLTYHPASYAQIEKIIQSIPEFYDGNYTNVKYFLDFKSAVLILKIEEIRSHTTSLVNFKQRFFQLFDAFQVIKFLHYLRDIKYPDVAINEASEAYFISINKPIQQSVEEQLLHLRLIEKK